MKEERMDEKLRKQIKLLKKIIRAYERLALAYRVGGQVPEWVWDTLEKWKYQEEEC